MNVNRDCVQCRAFGKGEKKDKCQEECSHFNMTLVDHRDKLPQPGDFDAQTHCKEKDIDDCWFYFTYSVESNKPIVHVVKTPGITSSYSSFGNSPLGLKLHGIQVLVCRVPSLFIFLLQPCGLQKSFNPFVSLPWVATC